MDGAAASAGFRYAVLTVKHCDGYTLWPSNYGDLGVKQKMNGRDLVRHQNAGRLQYGSGSQGSVPAAAEDWEQCEQICLGWSYRGPKAVCKPGSHLIERLARNRTWGGNYLPNFGPRPDGTMQPEFYTICDEMAAWMKHSAASIYDIEPGPYPDRCNCPVTVKGNTWFVHFIEYRRKAALLKGVQPPKSAVLLRTGKAVEWRKQENGILLIPAREDFTAQDDVVAVAW